MSDDTKNFVKNSLISGDDLSILLEYHGDTFFITINNCISKTSRYYFTDDSRMAQLYLHDIERIICDVRYLWFHGER